MDVWKMPGVVRLLNVMVLLSIACINTGFRQYTQIDTATTASGLMLYTSTSQSAARDTKNTPLQLAV
jgi:hypothetical protein